MPLNTDQQTFLITVLNFGDKLLSEDATITTEITALNDFGLNEDDVNQLEDVLQGAFDNLKPVSKPFMQSVIDGLTIIDQGYFSSLIGLVMDNPTLQEIRSVVAASLAITHVFLSDNHTFKYYKKLSMLAIASRDRALIQDAITKVQSL